MGSGEDSRRGSRRIPGIGDIKITPAGSSGQTQPIRGKLVDSSDWGVGIDTETPLQVGTEVNLAGPFFAARSGASQQRRGRILHTRLREGGLYRSGIVLEEALGGPQDANGDRRQRDASITDYYEILQISPNADTETIQRVYRMLAQRYHPDNSETGDEKTFQVVLHAYRVLSDPEKRAAYDVQYQASRALRWKVFDQPKATQGIEGEQKKRAGVLALLYAKMVDNPSQPGIMVRDFEELLGCPREHLDFTFWYLKQKSLIAGPDNGRYIITAAGVDMAESKGDLKQAEKRLMLESPRQQLPEGEPVSSR